MNKQFLLMAIASLMTVSVAAQIKGTDGASPRQPLSVSRVQPQFEVKDLQLREPGEAVPRPHRSPEFLKPYYLRPAGAFYSPFVAMNGVGWYSFGYDFIQVKPYSDYTYYSVANGADENDEVIWDYTSGGGFNTSYSEHLTVNYGHEITETPSLYLYHSDLDVDEWFQYPYYMMSEGNIVGGRKPAMIFSATDASILNEEGREYEFLLSSKTMCQGGRNGDASSIFVIYNEAVPLDIINWGYTFGKNGRHFDGMAQAFEKPTHPYLLKKVCMLTGYLECEAPVELCCKVYRMDEIPAYRDDEPVALSGDFGEPIVTGYTMVTPDTQEETGGLLTFTLFDHDELDPSLTYEHCPTIDCPILICIEGYNDPECDALRDFTCFLGNDIHVDEGYGELAYLKCPVKDEQGDFTGRYVWKGLNNLFSDGEMKTGYSIFIVADQPYLLFNLDDEPDEYCFDETGGEMRRELPTFEWITGIEFKSCFTSEDCEWSITNDGSEQNKWLDIRLVDGEEDGDFNSIFTAHVVAEPLPKKLDYRKAVVRFEIPGDYKEYTFIQRRTVIPIPPDYDVNGDGEVDIRDVYCVVYYILGVGSSYEGRTDVNHDGETNIADTNAVVDAILRY